MKKAPRRVLCGHCRHYYITWDTHFPFGCRRLNFKSRHQPSLEVFRSSGMPCQYYEEKKEKNHDHSP
ncbi:hypothetical protein Selin_1149 [Desulfurispirillum indicum S5]|uniref:Uracil-DNA glycosylase n=1 Tax=Desulfurispirillum indicum (strain ATCC BAA-1389 / DSM 22839 / S5) TaxID=653733 RepID=E6W4B0_DESIS|nr:hypothetical protein Selin_1149 [Desulfurispirillum indicum S5]